MRCAEAAPWDAGIFAGILAGPFAARDGGVPGAWDRLHLCRHSRFCPLPQGWRRSRRPWDRRIFASKHSRRPLAARRRSRRLIAEILPSILTGPFAARDGGVPGAPGIAGIFAGILTGPSGIAAFPRPGSRHLCRHSPRHRRPQAPWITHLTASPRRSRALGSPASLPVILTGPFAARDGGVPAPPGLTKPLATI